MGTVLKETQIEAIAHQIREDLEVIAGSSLADLRAEIERKVPSGCDVNAVTDDVLAYLLTQGWVVITEEDEVLVPVRPESLTKLVAKALEQNEELLKEEVRAKVPPSKKVRGWHVVDGVQNGFVQVGGKKVRLDPSTLKVTTADKASHGEVYFEGSPSRKRQYSDYVRAVGVENAVTPYEWMIRGWFTGVLSELVNSNPKVIEHREAKAALYRVDASELYGDYWQESEES